MSALPVPDDTIIASVVPMAFRHDSWHCECVCAQVVYSLRSVRVHRISFQYVEVLRRAYATLV